MAEMTRQNPLHLIILSELARTLLFCSWICMGANTGFGDDESTLMALSVFQVPAPFNSLFVATDREQHLISQTEWVCWVEISRQNKEKNPDAVTFCSQISQNICGFCEMKCGKGKLDADI